MPKKILTKEQITELLNLTIEIIQFIQEKRDATAHEIVEESIKNIQVPVRLSESIALGLLQESKITIEEETSPEDFKPGEGLGAFDIEYRKGDVKIDIEVKATGTSEFQRFRKHALDSDYTIWIDFHGLRNEGGLTKEIRFKCFKTKDVFTDVTDRTVEKTMTVKDLTAADKFNYTFTELNDYE
jgi:hypothetical protein